MDQILINGANVVYSTIPAGLAVISTALPIAGAITLNSGESSADVLVLNDGPGAPYAVIVGRPAEASIDATKPAVPVIAPARLIGSWIKVISNTTGQVATIKGIDETGTITAGLALAGGAVKLVCFAGRNTPFTLT